MATTNKDMADMLRLRRKVMAEAPYEGPVEEAVDEADVASETSRNPKTFTVSAPGEPATDGSFEYEPVTDMPGAWVVYPPGVPCDDTEYRITMKAPAKADDFAGMQQALDEAGATSPEPVGPSVVSELDSEEDVY